MNITISILITALLFGLYDVCIKLSSGTINPVLGAIVVQTTSALTAILYLVFLYTKDQQLIRSTPVGGVIISSLAGVLITIALVSLMYVLSQPAIRASQTLPSILVLRNTTLVLISIVFLQERFTVQNSLGLVISLVGVYVLLA